MARFYVSKHTDAEKIAGIMTELKGFRPTIFGDGGGYVVQQNDLRQEAVEEMMYDRGLKHLLDRDAIARIEWERNAR